jgi:hypothetical protein
MKLLIGNTGLVGSTILESESYDYTFNSKNLDTFTISSINLYVFFNLNPFVV